ncbi:hypothetical protein N2152v2_010413 [Parachlorella kessleri]
MAQQDTRWHERLQIYAETVDLDAIATVDPGIASVAKELGFGLGIKGGIARKMLKILHGTPEPATDDFDIDCILLAEPGLTPAEETELRKTVTGMQLGHLILEPKDVEVLSKEEVKTYWITRDICLNEVLLLRLTPGAPLTLFYSADALRDASTSVIRSIPHTLKSDFTECWALDGEKPILSAKHVARTIVRYFKGHGRSYEFDEILRTVHADDDKYRAVVTHLIDVGLISGRDVQLKGGFNGLWGATLKEVNDKMAQFGGRLSLEDLDAEAVERWIVQKKARMRSLPYRQRERASRTGSIPADEDTLALGLVSFPQQLLDYIEGEGGLWDPEHPQGQSPPEATPGISSTPGALPPTLTHSQPGNAAADVAARGGDDISVLPPNGAGASAFAAAGGGQQPGVSQRSWRETLAEALGLRRRPHEDLMAAGGEPALTQSLLSAAEPVGGDLAPGADLEGQAIPDPRPEGEGVAASAPADTVHFVPAQALMGASPAMPAMGARLGSAWLDQVAGSVWSLGLFGEDQGADEDDDEAGAPSGNDKPPARYSSAETLVYICRIAVAAWPLLVLASALIMVSVGLHLYYLRVQSEILFFATTGKRELFQDHIVLLIQVCSVYVFVNWLANVMLQLYLRRAMQQLYTGLFKHVLFQDSTFYDSISTSELATRTGVDMMNIRVLVGFLVQKVVKGATQVIAGVILLALFAGHLGSLSGIFVVAVTASMAELMGVSLILRGRHRIARSMLGRLYGFSYDVFSSIQGVIAMALQRTFTDTYSNLARSYFQAAMMLSLWMANHQLFLEAVFTVGVTVTLLYLGGTSLLDATIDIGTVYAMLRYVAVVEQGYVALSEAVARYFASYGSLEHVIDLHHRGQLTRLGKPAVLEALEREDAQEAQQAQQVLERQNSWDAAANEAAGWSNWSYRLTAESWRGGIRLKDVIYGYKGKPGNVLFNANLEVHPGEAALIMGRTGSGLSTLAHLLHLDISAGGGSVQFQTGSGAWLAFHPTSSDRYDMQACMGFASPRACIEALFFATVQENMICACLRGHLPSIAACQEAAAVSGFDVDVAQLPDGYQTLVGDASRVALAPTARLRLGLARLLLLEAPKLVIIDDADRFVTASPGFAGALALLRSRGAAVVMTTNSVSAHAVRAALPEDVRVLQLDGGRLRPAA